MYSVRRVIHSNDHLQDIFQQGARLSASFTVDHGADFYKVPPVTLKEIMPRRPSAFSTLRLK